ncbi:MAG: YfcE family phosphodiesterase [Eubacterium sp.]
MARYIVFSDSHGKNDLMYDIIRENQDQIDGLFHLGDIDRADEELSLMIKGPVYIVRGNCDTYSDLSEEHVFKMHGHKIAMTHGHHQHVEHGVDILKYWALQNQADVVLYGHTHVPFVEQSSQMTILNPGSISRPRQSGFECTYAWMEFLPNGEISIEIVKVVK